MSNVWTLRLLVVWCMAVGYSAENLRAQDEATSDAPPAATAGTPAVDGPPAVDGASAIGSSELTLESSIKNTESTPAADAEPNPLPENDPSFDNAAETKVFEDAIQRWRELLTEMRSVMIRFKNGTPEEGQALALEYRQLEQRGRVIYDEAFASAVKLLKGAPRDNFVAAQFLLVAVRHRYDRGWYELTGDGAVQLMRVRAKDDTLNEVAGVSFFSTGEYDKAEAFLVAAAQQGQLSEEHFPKLGVLSSVRKAWQEELAARELDAQKDDLPRVRLNTSRGEILVELFEDAAPNTVANFIKLVEDGAINGLPFYEVLPGQVALAGDIRGGAEAEFCIPDENAREGKRKLFRGTLTMKKFPDSQNAERQTIPDTASQHFLIALSALPWADPEHTAFGRILEGMATVSAFTHVNTAEPDPDAPPSTPDVILSAEIVRKRDHDYTPERINTSPVEMATRLSGGGAVHDHDHENHDHD